MHPHTNGSNAAELTSMFLSDVERSILAYLLMGETHKRIAAALSMGNDEVAARVFDLCRKLPASSRDDLMEVARRLAG